MAAYGLIGYPLGHSFSPAYFADKFARLGINASYQAFELTNISQLPTLLATHPLLAGLNVTIPYKQQVLQYLHQLSPAVQAIGAANCIRIKDGLLIGHNTDYIGFMRSLQPLLQPHHTQALILGTGGSSLAVSYALRQLGISYQLVSRSQAPSCITYKDIDQQLLYSHSIIINTSPVGMHPHYTDAPALPYHLLTPHHLLFDLIYNPAQTRMLQLGQQMGCITKNGYEMLQLQADASWDIWNE